MWRAHSKDDDGEIFQENGSWSADADGRASSPDSHFCADQAHLHGQVQTAACGNRRLFDSSRF